jgi:hypothetical protein
LAHKAEDGKFSWVEFSPQFHSHLVKCAVVLVPRPIEKVKKVMFSYVLELLNEEGPQAFFALTKGQRRDSQAQKEKKRLARKRNRASRRERRKAAEEAVEGLPQRKCEWCGRKFASRKTAKRHRCPLAKGARRGEVGGKGKGKTVTDPKLGKPGPTLPPNPSTSTTTPARRTTISKPGGKKKRPRAPSSAREAALAEHPGEVWDGAFHSSTPRFGPSSTRTSERLNTSKKRRIRKGVMESVDAHDQTR